MEKILSTFIDETNIKFDSLKKYGFEKVNDYLYNSGYFPDSEMIIQYINKYIGLEVYWYFAGAVIGVSFIKLENGKYPAKKNFFNPNRNAIDIYWLAEYLNEVNDECLILKNVDDVSVSKIKKREIVIKENLSEIIDGLFIAVEKFAENIIMGDVSIF